MNPNVRDIPGYGVDADPKSRPGYPREESPQLRGDAQGPPSRQESDVTVFKHGQPARKFPPVFGTAQPRKASPACCGAWPTSTRTTGRGTG